MVTINCYIISSVGLFAKFRQCIQNLAGINQNNIVNRALDRAHDQCNEFEGTLHKWTNHVTGEHVKTLHMFAPCLGVEYVTINNS